ncbi:hypothetical protein GCM10007860_33740 [Chitiniphilus shinanonensis]|uniref:Transcriptional regulator HTH-type FeoC domain-containing protein n=1 Tax=Chitiniphilus shinanonensis TaxID=553088 RepID=A0ABQ6C2H9_9NEIS|nr:FeoC-like transcriptional regulator [Chitiniphilus shinanonensis]GLS06204.1 hypothetical protein GCM10007860_33740 [Chitiniphilus shinanonensis]
MTPSDIRQYLRERGQASLADLAAHFDAEPDAVRDVIAHWVRKGRVSEIGGASCGKSCCGCGTTASVAYRWHEAGEEVIPIAPPPSHTGCGGH